MYLRIQLISYLILFPSINKINSFYTLEISPLITTGSLKKDLPATEKEREARCDKEVKNCSSRARTCDNLINSQALYQLSYRASMLKPCRIYIYGQYMRLIFKSSKRQGRQ